MTFSALKYNVLFIELKNYLQKTLIFILNYKKCDVQSVKITTNREDLLNKTWSVGDLKETC